MIIKEPFPYQPDNWRVDDNILLHITLQHQGSLPLGAGGEGGGVWDEAEGAGGDGGGGGGGGDVEQPGLPILLLQTTYVTIDNNNYQKRYDI